MLLQCTPEPVGSIIERGDSEPLSENNRFTKSMVTRNFSRFKMSELLRFMQNNGVASRSSEDYGLLVLPLGTVYLDSGIGVVQEDTGGINFSFHLEAYEEVSGVIYNYIIKEDNQELLIEAYILEYTMSLYFQEQYVNGDATLEEFEGTLRLLSMNSSRSIEPLCPEQEVGDDDGESESDGNQSGDGDSGGGTNDGDTGEENGNPVGDGDNPFGDDPEGGTLEEECKVDRFVRGCSGTGSAEWHLARECGVPEGQRPSNVQYNFRMECFPTQKSSGGRASGGCGDEDVILIENDADADLFEEMNLLLYNPAFQNALATIQTNASGSDETGYEIAQNPDTGAIATNYVVGNSNFIRLKQGGDIVGGIHNHTNFGSKMFSASDIAVLLNYFLKNENRINSDVSPQDVFTVIVVPGGNNSTKTYALRIRDYFSLAGLFNNVGLSELNSTLEYAYNNRFALENQSKYEKGFLSVIEEYKNKGLINGSPLAPYELNAEGSSFEEVTLSDNGDLNSNTPCD